MIKKNLSRFTILLGAAIYAFGLTYFVVPHHLFEGGATGITLITFYLFKIPVSLMNLLINIPLFYPSLENYLEQNPSILVCLDLSFVRLVGFFLSVFPFILIFKVIY